MVQLDRRRGAKRSPADTESGLTLLQLWFDPFVAGNNLFALPAPLVVVAAAATRFNRTDRGAGKRTAGGGGG